jgi:ATP-dependent Clp protease, protease subunit
LSRFTGHRFFSLDLTNIFVPVNASTRMPQKELYLYSPIYSYTAEALITSMEEFKKDGVKIRMNTPGGYINYGWGVIAKMQELDSKKTIVIDGAADSMGLFMLPFADEVIASDVATGLLHRADGYVANADDQKNLDDRNKDLRKKFAAKIDETKLKELKGITLDDVFASDKRIDVRLTAKEMKAIGLVDKIVTLTPKEAQANSDMMEVVTEKMKQIAAMAINPEIPAIPGDTEPEAKKDDKSKTDNTMTLAELKAKHPDLYAQIVSEGVTAERDRVGSWMAFVDVDVKAVSEGIKKGENLSATAMAELSRKSLSAEALKGLAGSSANALPTGEVKDEKGKDGAVKTDAEKQKDASAKSFQEEVLGQFGIKTAKA